MNHQKASPYPLESKVYFGYPDGESRTLLKFMAAQRLSVFGTTDRSYYTGIGLLPALTATQTTLGVPTKGAILSGVRVHRRRGIGHEWSSLRAISSNEQ